ncbi:sensor histidine kinase [Cognatishimia sp.]|uniref:sensor histidine kinase n=1 Tax=Cognatishimia sp. TaxID=2211648 RepID=UPI0035140FD8
MFLTRLKGLLGLSAMRQTLSLLALFSLISLLAWGGTYVLVKREMLRAVDDRLSARLTQALSAIDTGQALPLPADGESIGFVTAVRRDGFFTRDEAGTDIETRFLLHTTGQGQLQLGEDTELQEELRDMLAAGMQLSLFGTLLVSGLMGLWLARRSQIRLNQINAGLASVAGGHLNTRIRLSGNDDLSLLAERINTTTERLEDAMTQMQVQSSNIAHDLRTPLARLRAQLESGLSAAAEQQRPVDPDTLTLALEQIDRITGTFDALLRLARIESGAGRAGFAPVDLGALLKDVGEIFGPVIEDAGQVLRLDISAPAPIHGDRDLLMQLLANLIQNALRYGADGQTVTLQIDGTRLALWDEGPGIPESAREAALQPLHQGETTRQGEGYGLGLSLVRAIAKLHDATLRLSEGPEGCGLQVTVQFPKLTNL